MLQRKAITMVTERTVSGSTGSGVHSFKVILKSTDHSVGIFYMDTVMKYPVGFCKPGVEHTF